MSERVTATIEVSDWKDEPFAAADGGPSLSRPHGVDLYHGGIEAEATWSGLMVAGEDGSGPFQSLQRVVGRVGDRAGSFVLQVNGTYEGGTTAATCLIIPLSGTGDLSAIRGTGGLVYGDKEASIWLDVSVAPGDR